LYKSGNENLRYGLAPKLLTRLLWDFWLCYCLWFDVVRLPTSVAEFHLQRVTHKMSRIITIFLRIVIFLWTTQWTGSAINRYLPCYTNWQYVHPTIMLGNRLNMFRLKSDLCFKYNKLTYNPIINVNILILYHRIDLMRF